jgi:hypothetical protein
MAQPSQQAIAYFFSSNVQFSLSTELDL